MPPDHDLDCQFILKRALHDEVLSGQYKNVCEHMCQEDRPTDTTS